MAAAPPMPPAITAIAMIVFFPKVLALELDVLAADEAVGVAPTMEVMLTVPLARDLLAGADVCVFVLMAIVGVEDGVVVKTTAEDEVKVEDNEDTVEAVVDTIMEEATDEDEDCPKRLSNMPPLLVLPLLSAVGVGVGVVCCPPTAAVVGVALVGVAAAAAATGWVVLVAV